MKISKVRDNGTVVEVEVDESELMAVVEQLKNGVDADDVVLNTSKGLADVFGYRRGGVVFTVGKDSDYEMFSHDC